MIDQFTYRKTRQSRKEASYKMLTSKYYPAYERLCGRPAGHPDSKQPGSFIIPGNPVCRGGTLTALHRDNDTKDGTFGYDRFMAEVTVRTPCQCR